MSQATYPGHLPLPVAIRRLAQAKAADDHHLWPEDLSLCDPKRVDVTPLPAPRLATDGYLLALAIAHGGRLVTFDQGIPLAPVAGATSRHLLML